LLAACESTPEEVVELKSTGDTSQQTAGQQQAEVAAAPTQEVTVVPGSAEDFVLNVGDRVFFDFDRYDLKADAQRTLDSQAAWLKKYPSASITIEGHCDERGTREYNLALGDRRAQSVKDYLVSLGIDPGRLTTISYGKERPAVAGPPNEATWSLNRRGVTVIN
jgi:peptidoglycan-associated lipoprotein